MHHPVKIDGIATKPVIHMVIDVATGRSDVCTPGGRFVIRGKGLGSLDELDEETGVFLHGSGKEMERVERYECWNEREIRGSWPDHIQGPVWLLVEPAEYCGTGHNALHRIPVTPTR